MSFVEHPNIDQDSLITFYYFRSRLQKLPDKGKKIQDLYDRVEKQLEISHQIDNAADLLSALNIGKCDITSIEWNRKSNMENKSTEVLDSDDDEEGAGNPFAILANSNTVHQNKKLVHNVQEIPESLVTLKDIQEAEEITSSDLHLEIGAVSVCNKESMELSDRFLPYRFKTIKTKTDESTPSKPEKIRDNTAASYPILKCGVKMLTLRDSIEIENIQRKKMLVVLEKQAADRLETRLKLNPAIGLPTSDIPRNVAIRGVEHVFDTDEEESEEEEEQEFDEGDE